MGARFSVDFRTGPGAQPASCTMGTGSFPGVNRPGRGVDHPSNLAPRLKKEYSYTSTPLWAFVACFRMNFAFTFTYFCNENTTCSCQRCKNLSVAMEMQNLVLYAPCSNCKTFRTALNGINVLKSSHPVLNMFVKC